MHAANKAPRPPHRSGESFTHFHYTAASTPCTPTGCQLCTHHVDRASCLLLCFINFFLSSFLLCFSILCLACFPACFFLACILLHAYFFPSVSVLLLSLLSFSLKILSVISSLIFFCYAFISFNVFLLSFFFFLPSFYIFVPSFILPISSFILTISSCFLSFLLSFYPLVSLPLHFTFHFSLPCISLQSLSLSLLPHLFFFPSSFLIFPWFDKMLSKCLHHSSHQALICSQARPSLTLPHCLP